MIGKVTRVVTQVAAAIALVLALGSSNPASAQPTAWRASPSSPEDLAEVARTEWLAPVLENLRRSAHEDPQLAELLREVRLWTLTTPRVEWGPNAVATTQAGAPMIYVDLVFLNEIFATAEVAGVALTGRDEAGDILYQWGENYGKSVGHAVVNRLPAPTPSFDIHSAIGDPGLRVMSERMAWEVFFSTAAWIVLHEVAHHRLEHLRRDPTSKGEARKWETEADLWAAGQIEELGYGLAPVHASLGTLEVMQTIRALGGLVPPESASDHPHWSTRRKELERQFDVEAPPRGTILAVLNFIGDDQGRFHAVETWIPRRPDLEGHLFAVQSGAGWQPFEWKDGRVHMYGRNAERRTEWILEEPDELKPDITIHEVRLADGTASTSKTRGFRVNMAWSADLDVGPLKARDITGTSPVALFSAALRQVVAEPAVIAAAERIQLDQLQSTRGILIRYAKGELPRAEGERLVTASAEHAGEQVETIVGPARWQQVRDALFADQIVQFGFDEMIGKMINDAGRLTPPQPTRPPEASEEDSSIPALDSRALGTTRTDLGPPPLPAPPWRALRRTRTDLGPPPLPAPPTGSSERELCDEYARGLSQDLKGSTSRLRRGVEAGYPSCAYNLGMTWYMGDSYAEAYGLFLNAALSGHAEAQYMLARMYAAGEGVQVDSAKTLFWTGVAASSGNDFAMRLCQENGIDYTHHDYQLTPENLWKYGYQR